ncbi:MAG: hypothetical protein UW09_C0004G0117 [candidate division TM6 bacterium GW2011_GWF2_43_87]|nr:MAG: hypothetical protein UW09_C0004G0117 [candidate division TM6 bacterium GW2011_GWF2_43_87]
MDRAERHEGRSLQFIALMSGRLMVANRIASSKASLVLASSSDLKISVGRFIESALGISVNVSINCGSIRTTTACSGKASGISARATGLMIHEYSLILSPSSPSISYSRGISVRSHQAHGSVVSRTRAETVLPRILKVK